MRYLLFCSIRVLIHLLAEFASAIAIELRRGSPPDVRDFLRIRFKNGTASTFKDVHVFEHKADIPLTEFIYRAEVSTLLFRAQAFS